MCCGSYNDHQNEKRGESKIEEWGAGTHEQREVEVQKLSFAK